MNCVVIRFFSPHSEAGVDGNYSIRYYDPPRPPLQLPHALFVVNCF